MDVTFTRASRWYLHQWAENFKKLLGFRWFTAWALEAKAVYGCLFGPTKERGDPWGYTQLRIKSMVQSHSMNRKPRSQSAASPVLFMDDYLMFSNAMYCFIAYMYWGDCWNDWT